MAQVGLWTVILFVITLVLGIILHLKSHGTIIQPRGLIKFVHYICGFAMVALAYVHASQFWTILPKVKTRGNWFKKATCLTVLTLILVFLTGLVKLASPVKIPHLGLWHYWLGIIMSAAIIVHLIKGVPTLIKMLSGKFGKK